MESTEDTSSSSEGDSPAVPLNESTSSSSGDSPVSSTKASSSSEGDSSMSETEGTSSSEDDSPIIKRQKTITVGKVNQTENGQSSQPRKLPTTYLKVISPKRVISSPESRTICVRGYKVKNSIASILEAIFKKHGDIAAECVFKTDCVRASFLELVCEVVNQLQTNDDKYIISKMEEIESKVSEAESANIKISWLRSYLDAFRKTKEAMEKSSLLLLMKANTSLVKRSADMDLKERGEELMVAQQRFEKAERCVKVLGLVEKKLHNNIMVSKTEEALWERPANVLD